MLAGITGTTAYVKKLEDRRDFLISRSQKFLLASAERSEPSCSVVINTFSDKVILVKCDNYLDNYRLEEEINKPLEKVIVRFRETWSTNENYIIGVFIEGNLMGCAGFEREQRKKLRHKGNVWGMYVIPDLRGQGVGRLLLRELIKQSGSLEGLEQLDLASL